jgi:hypothetical protein
MTASTTPLETIIGSQTIDKSIVPIVANDYIVIKTYGLKPGAIAHFWLDDKNVDKFVQPASQLTVNVGYNANLFTTQQGIYCPNTHSYALVQENSQESILYLSENFACINVTPYGSNTLASLTQFTPNSIVYQANNAANVYANSFIGRVAYWDSTNGALAISVTSGTLNNISTTNVLFTVGSTKLANVTGIVLGNKFPTGQTIISVANTSQFFLANGYNPNHGLIINANVGSLFQVSGLSPNSNIVGSEIYVTGGTGIGQTANIIAWNVTTGYITIDTTWTVAGDSYYRVGNVIVDNIGTCVGILHIPEDPNFNFQTGSRLVTINDSLISQIDSYSTMRATATLVVAGQLPIGTATTPIVSKTPQLSPTANSIVAPSAPTSTSITNNGPVTDPSAISYPLVQTFFTPKSNTNGTDFGCFATSVNIFFQNVPTGNSTQFPVTVYIVDTLNGYPTSNILAFSTVRYESISYTNGINTFPNVANSQTYTNFSFPDPVYLTPGEEYGIVVYSESPDYNIWVSQTGQTVANGTSLVSQSPYVGSFFEAQNSSAWNPIPNQQMMFILNKAAFSQSAVGLTFGVRSPTQNIYMDLLTLHSADLTFPSATITYGVQSTTANNGITDSGFIPVNIDTPYYYGAYQVNSSLDSNRRRLIQEGNANTVLVNAVLSSSNPDISPMFHSEAFELVSFGNIINNGGISASDITILTPGNHGNTANIVITISSPTGDGGIQATANVLPNGITGNALTSINIINPGAGYVISPTITIAEYAASSNATAVINGENAPSGGNGNVRYITRPISLASGFASGDLNVFLTAIRPQGTDILVYYKVLGTADIEPISNVSWQLMTKENDIYSPDQQTPINLSYNTGYNSLGVPIGSIKYVQNGVTYPLGGLFQTFQIKIVLFANDPTVCPEVQTMRGVAVPGG